MTQPNQNPEANASINEQDQLLTGARQLGAVPGPNNSLAIHAETRDGAKFTRIQGEPYASAADFASQKLAEADRFEDLVGVRPAGAPPRRIEEASVAVTAQGQERSSRLGYAIGRLLGR